MQHDWLQFTAFADCLSEMVALHASHFDVAGPGFGSTSPARERSDLLLASTMIRSKKHLAAATPFTMEELKASISKMRRKGAPCPDDIIPAFLKELGPSALSELLAICNQSLNSAECPQN